MTESKRLGADAFSTEYLPALDGLRGLSVLAVLALHGSYGHVSGGFLGVDVFFAISGFIITRNIAAECARSGSVSLRDFYVRRAARLLPALVLAIFLAAILWRRVSSADPVGAILASLFYYANWRAAVLGPHAMGPLSHTWSLSVEEQYYLVWPLLMGALWPVVFSRRRRALCGLAAAVLLAACLRWYWFSSASVLGTYWASTSRVDQLLIGAALTFWLGGPSGVGVLRSVPLRVAAGVGAAILLSMILLLRPDDPFLYQGGFSLVALIAVLIIGVTIANPGRMLSRVLASSILVRLGRISYGIYLFHFPIFLALESLRVSHSRVNFVAVLGLRVIASIAVALASFKLVESPALRIARRWVHRVPPAQN